MPSEPAAEAAALLDIAQEAFDRATTIVAKANLLNGMASGMALTSESIDAYRSCLVMHTPTSAPGRYKHRLMALKSMRLRRDNPANRRDVLE